MKFITIKEKYSKWLEGKSQLTKRLILGISMYFGFCLIIYGGPMPIMITTTTVQVLCFREVIKIAYKAKNLPEDSILRKINYYFLFVANYFFYGELFKNRFETYVNSCQYLKMLISLHRFISFCIYLVGFVWFVKNLKRKQIRTQFSLFFWTHFLVITIGLQSVMMSNIVFEGLIWCAVPIFLVVMNDIFAYMFGKLYGKTPLIHLSPKKTREGFIYGGIATVLFAIFMSEVLCHFKLLICPIKYINTPEGIKQTTDCTPSYIFQPIYFYGIKTFPFVFHSLIISAFASIICPFGGFFASGFKRAMKVKDFGNVIPGHGGVMDRNDCQYLMGTFINVYISTFIRADVENIFDKFLYMEDAQQLEFFDLLKNHLINSNLLNNTLTN